jgi:dsDNA-specific endonuclease/ATPase MutS2
VAKIEKIHLKAERKESTAARKVAKIIKDAGVINAKRDKAQARAAAKVANAEAKAPKIAAKAADKEEKAAQKAQKDSAAAKALKTARNSKDRCCDCTSPSLRVGPYREARTRCVAGA